MELFLHEYELPLKHPFTISRSTTTTQQTLIVELQQDGVSGYGEAIANTYYDSPMDSMRARLQSARTMLDGETFRDTESYSFSHIKMNSLVCTRRLREHYRFRNICIFHRFRVAKGGPKMQMLQKTTMFPRGF